VVIALLGGIPELCIKPEGNVVNMEKAPDLILSGINAGANLGTDIVYSGTAAAARQGSLFGIPSIALSLVENDAPWQWDAVISYITENLSIIKSYWKAGSFVNVNFPNIEKKPLSLVPVFHSMRYYNDRIVTFMADDDCKYCFAKPGRPDNIPEPGSDWAEVLKNNAAISVVMSEPAVLHTG
jgi:5'-nucleotidase